MNQPLPKFEKRDPKTQGCHILKSYLSALKIPFVAGAESNEILVTTTSGKPLPVRVNHSFELNNDYSGIVIDTNELSSYKLDQSLKQLHAVTIAGGYGKPIPIDRGVSLGRISYLDNFEDVYLRHSVFRRSPNCKESDLLPYMKTITAAARRANYRWKTVFSAMGFGENDLVNVALVYTVSFLHNYASDTISDNTGLLSEFLYQRFGEFAKITSKKAQSATCLPQSMANDISQDGETSYTELFAEHLGPGADEEYEEESFILTFSDGKSSILGIKNDGMLGLDMYLDNRKLTPAESKNLTDDLRHGRVKKSVFVGPEAPNTNNTELRKLVKDLTAQMVGNDEAAVALHRLLPSLDENTRKKVAKDILYARLDNLQPEQRQTLLGYAALSRDYCPDSQREARRLADEMICPVCKQGVPSGPLCSGCDTFAVPRFNVDYMAFRHQLEASHHPMAEAMITSIPDSEQRAKKAKSGMISSKNDSLSKTDKEAIATKLKAELLAKIPPVAECPKCHKTKEIAEFGLRVSKNKTTGIPARAARQAYCKACRKLS